MTSLAVPHSAEDCGQFMSAISGVAKERVESLIGEFAYSAANKPFPKTAFAIPSGLQDVVASMVPGIQQIPSEAAALCAKNASPSVEVYLVHHSRPDLTQELHPRAWAPNAKFLPYVATPEFASTDASIPVRVKTPFNISNSGQLVIPVVFCFGVPIHVLTIGFLSAAHFLSVTHSSAVMQYLLPASLLSSLVDPHLLPMTVQSEVAVHVSCTPAAAAEAIRAAIPAYYILSKFILLIINLLWINVYKHLRLRYNFLNLRMQIIPN